MVIKTKRISGLSAAINNTVREVAVNATKSSYCVRVANSLKDKKASFRMAYSTYLEKEFVAKGSCYLDLYTIDHDQEKDTVIFNVYHEGDQLAGTMTLAFDHSRKIPSEVLFSTELNQLRGKNQRLAEVTRLVIDKRFRNSSKVLELMIDCMMAYCFYNDKADTLICEVHPHHKNFYTRLLGFTEISQAKPCPLVGGSPAVALAMPLSIYEREITMASSKKLKYYKKFTPSQAAQQRAKVMAKELTSLSEEEMWQIGLTDLELTSVGEM